MIDKDIKRIGLLMVKEDISVFPRYPLADGYTLCTYRPGMEADWIRLQCEAGLFEKQEDAKTYFEKEFLPYPEELMRNCLFVLDLQDAAVATATLWHGEHFGKYLQRIHWVAVSPQHQGKGLAKALLSRLLDLYCRSGSVDPLYLISQTWSYPAIGIYLRFGFQPYLGEKPVNWKSENFAQENEEAWKIVFEKLGDFTPAKSCG